MKIALFGYGRMGKEVEAIARTRGHEIVLVVDKDNASDITTAQLQQAEVAIDFSLPQTAYTNINNCFDAHLPVVTGTTGWLDKLPLVEERARNEKQSFLYASNISLGVNLFFAFSEQLSKLMGQFEMYEPAIDETHHIHKQDAPSGTAITLAERVLPNMPKKQKWSLEAGGEAILAVTAHRKGEVPGNHQLTYDSEFDTIKLEHNAKSRRGFAMGAVLAAEYVHNKKGIFTMKDVLNIE